jgi:hypothetical protein
VNCFDDIDPSAAMPQAPYVAGKLSQLTALHIYFAILNLCMIAGTVVSAVPISSAVELITSLWKHAKPASIADQVLASNTYAILVVINCVHDTVDGYAKV